MKKFILVLCTILSVFALCLVGCNDNRSDGGNTESYTYRDEVTTPATCTTDGVRTFYCNEDESKNYTEVIPALGHDKSAHLTNAGANGHYYKCTRCDEKFDISEHSFGPLVTAPGSDVHWRECACGEKSDVSEHSADAEYSNDGTYHWHSCACGYKFDVHEHEFGGYEEINGNRVKSCVCGYEVTMKKAKVIVLAGQSNASGYTYSYHLDNKSFEKYSSGFDDIKIYYENNPLSTDPDRAPNVSREFVKVKLGQGRNTETFGPEIGVAEYLSEIYPDEEIFIIKSATGGSTLNARWYSPSSLEILGKDSVGDLYTQMLNTVDAGMDILLRDYDAEIVQFMWMQGENDSLSYAGFYTELFDNMIDDAVSVWSEAGYLPDNGLSVVQGGITDHWSNYKWTNLAKQYYADNHSKGYFIDVANSDWCSYDKDNTDYAHHDATSMVRLGREFGKAFKLAVDDLDNPEVVTPHALGGSGTETDPYIISTQYDLLLFVASVNCGYDDYAEKFVKLNSDLWLDCKIGFGGALSRYFAGTFDGNGKTLDAHIVSTLEAGVFARTAAGSIVKNLNVIGSIVSQGNYSGGIAGIAFGDIDNCVNAAKISGKGYLGGIAGATGEGSSANTVTVSNSKNLGTVSADGDGKSVRIGGITGELYGNIENCVNGYTAQEIADGKTQCAIIGNNDKTSYAGGIAGSVQAARSEIIGCVNYADVSAKAGVGGIVGLVNVSNVTIDGCSVYGKIVAVNNVGGILGALKANMNGLTVKEFVIACTVKIGESTATTAVGGTTGDVTVPGLIGGRVGENKMTVGAHTHNDNGASPVKVIVTPGNCVDKEIYRNKTVCVYCNADILGDETEGDLDPNNHKGIDGDGYIAPSYATAGNTGSGDCFCGNYHFDGETIAPQKENASDYGVEDNPFILANQTDMDAFVADVNGGDKFTNKFFRLTADVTLDTVIGATKDVCFGGIFDGNGHAVTATVSASSGNVGVFGYLPNGATVKNLTVKGAITNNATGNDPTGGIAGWIYGAVDNCTVLANVTGKGNRVGGIGGYIGTGTVKDCVVGYAENAGAQSVIRASKNYAGGIIGYAYTGTPLVTGCKNYASVCAVQGVGGIVGLVNIGSTAVISNSYNYGNVSGVNGGEAQSAGGIAGRVADDATAKLTVTNSIVGAEVTVNGKVVTALNEKGSSTDSKSTEAGYIVGTVGAKGVYTNNNSGVESV